MCARFILLRVKMAGRGGRPRLSESERKDRKKQRNLNYRSRQISLTDPGLAERWQATREKTGSSSDGDLASLLLDTYDSWHGLHLQTKESNMEQGSSTMSVGSPERMLFESPFGSSDTTLTATDMPSSDSDFEEDLEDKSEEDQDEDPEDLYSPSQASIREALEESPWLSGSEALENEPLVEGSDDEEEDDVSPTVHAHSPQFGLCDKSSLTKLASLNWSTCAQCGETWSPEWGQQGTAFILKWKCTSGHTATWQSQEMYKGGMMKGDAALSASIVLSGNNYDKVSLMFQTMNMGITSRSVHYKLQSHYVCPVVQAAYQEHEQHMLAKYKGKSIIIAGDGRCDSPGFCAKNLTYTVLNAETGELLLLRVYDKRQAGGKSGQMEVMALREALKTLRDAGVHLKECVTDQHAGIIKMLREDFPDIQHSLDIWHTAKNLGKKLNAVAQKASTRALKPWIPDLTNHFWFAAKECGGDIDKFAEIWTGCLNHVVGVHEWVTGACCHDDCAEPDNKAYLKPGDTAHEALKQIITAPTRQKLYPMYVNARTTYTVESFNNLILVYASKRVSYRFPAYQARCQLAAIDYKENTIRTHLYNKEGQVVLHRKYSKQSGRWTAYAVPAPKNRQYLWELLGRVLEAKALDRLPSSRAVVIQDEDPLNISATLAPVPPPATSKLWEEHRSRLAK